MKIETKLVEKTESVHRFEVLVNHKRQGIILGIPQYEEGKSNPSISSWMVEGDAFRNKYADSQKAIEALCSKNGRKIKFKEKKK